jgi:hypothetical protein
MQVVLDEFLLQFIGKLCKADAVTFAVQGRTAEDASVTFLLGLDLGSSGGNLLCVLFASSLFRLVLCSGPLQQPR